jgi:hypothetical protein
MATLLRRVRQRSWRDRVLVGQAAAAVVAAGVAVRVLPFRRLVQWTGRVAPGHAFEGRALNAPGATPDVSSARRVVWAVEAVARRLFPARPCLPQALAARFLLARRGVTTDLHIGVARTADGELAAHAWLEREGRVLIGGLASPREYQLLVPPSASSPSSST